MSFFKSDYSTLKTDLVPEGRYECFIEDARPDATPGGTEYINIRLRIRKDLDKALPNTNGKQHNRVLFCSVWRRKATQQYSSDDLNAISKAAGLPDGASYDALDKWTDALIDKPVSVAVTIDKSEYQGKATERNQIWANSFRTTKYPLSKQQEDPFKGSEDTANEQTIADDADDLPF